MIEKRKKVRETNAVGYVRISTNEDKQKYGLEVQERAIREYCSSHKLNLVRVYQDENSAKSIIRPGIKSLLDEKNEYQVLVVYKLDRLSRSLFDLLKLIHEDFKDKEVVFIKEGIDQRTKEGRLLLHQLASFAEYERELIVSRIKDGLSEAKIKGVRLGRRPKYELFREKVREMKAEGFCWKQICLKLKIDYRTAKKAFG